MKKKLILTGGEQYLDAKSRPEGARFKCAKLIEVDLANSRWNTLIEYKAKNNNYPPAAKNSIFVSASIEENHLYLCTSTELFVYSYPELELLRTVSYPFFQNLHHVLVHNNEIVVVSTGLDMIVFLDKETLKPIRFKNSLGKDPWHKYSQQVDYRQFVSLKPHESHPNFAFSINGELWVTRFNQMDAVLLNDMSIKIDIGVERGHDGFIYNNKVHFTTINGCIVIADAKSGKRLEVIDLNKIEGTKGPMGWCRGLFIEDDIAYVAFTKIRDTKIKENIKWALSKLRSEKESNTKVSAYNIRDKTKIAEMILPPNSVNAIYSILSP